MHTCPLCTLCAHFVHTLCTLCTLCSQNSAMFRVRHYPNFAPCPHSTLTTSQYHGRSRCGLNGQSSSRLDGQLWSAVEGGLQLLSGGGGAETCPATCCQIPNQRSRDLRTGRVSTPGLSTARCTLPEPTERGSGYLGLDLAQVCTKN